MRLALFFVAVLTGCSSPQIHEPIRPLRDFRGIIHCHSKYSHDSQGTYEEILAAAKAAKVDFICMTDHPPSGDKGLPLREGWTGIHDGVLFIQGAEYSDQILGLGLKEPISGKDRRETIKAIHAQGGVAIACHPEEIDDWDAYAEADGMEIYNVHATLKRKSKDKGFLVQVAKKLKEDPEHSFELLQDLDPAILKKWDEINRTRLFVGIAGNDAHQNVKPFGLQMDPYPRAFKFVSTHILAEELTQDAVLKALREGKAWVSFEVRYPQVGVWPPTTNRWNLTIWGTSAPERERRDFTDGEPWEFNASSDPPDDQTFRETISWGMAGVHRTELWYKQESRWVPWMLPPPLRISSNP